MTTVRNLIIYLIFTTLCSCNNSMNDNTNKAKNDSIFKDTTIISDELNNSVTSKNENEKADNITTIKFNELSISINELPLADYERDMNQIQKDSIGIDPEIGYTVEGQIFTINKSLLEDLKIEQSYATTIGVYMRDENAENDGEYCYLDNWKHYRSKWKAINLDTLNRFIYPAYTYKERQIFNASIDEVKNEVFSRCGKNTAGKLTSVSEAPCEVTISTCFLRISGKRKRDGKPIIIHISFNVGSGGC